MSRTNHDIAMLRPSKLCLQFGSACAKKRGEWMRIAGHERCWKTTQITLRSRAVGLTEHPRCELLSHAHDLTKSLLNQTPGQNEIFCFEGILLARS
jgi:hypothetical protein